jgi:hypothetical protein
MPYPIQAPNSAAAAPAAAAISRALTSSAENWEEWHSGDVSDVHEVTMVAQMMLREVHTFVTGPSCNQVRDTSEIARNFEGDTEVQLSCIKYGADASIYHY